MSFVSAKSLTLSLFLRCTLPIFLLSSLTDSCEINSLSNLVTASLTEDAGVGCGQEILFAAFCVRDLLRKLLWRARQIRLLSWVVLELLHVDAFLRESKLDIA